MGEKEERSTLDSSRSKPPCFTYVDKLLSSGICVGNPSNYRYTLDLATKQNNGSNTGKVQPGDWPMQKLTADPPVSPPILSRFEHEYEWLEDAVPLTSKQTLFRLENCQTAYGIGEKKGSYSLGLRSTEKSVSSRQGLNLTPRRKWHQIQTPGYSA